MKRSIKFLALAFVMLLLAGCKMKADYQIEIGKDKNVTLTFVVAQDDEMIDAMLSMKNSSSSSSTTTSTKTYTDQERWEYVESSTNDNDYKDFKKEKYDKDGFKGYTYTLSLGSLDNLVADNSDSTDFEKITKESKIFTKSGDTYKLNLKPSDTDVQQMQQYKSSVGFDVTMTVKLPNEAKNNNATIVDKTTYTWDLTQTNDINLEFEIGNNNNLMIIIGGSCAVVAIAIGVVAVVLKNKKDNK